MTRKEIIAKIQNDAEFAAKCLASAPMTHEYPESQLYRLVVDGWQFFMEVYSNGAKRLIY